MSVAIPIPLLQNLPDVSVTPGAGVDEYALVWDNDTERFVLRAAPVGSLLATGATTGATSQAQAFTNGIVGPSWKPAANSTTALQLQNAAGVPVVTVDTTNSRVGIGKTPEKKFDLYLYESDALTTRPVGVQFYEDAMPSSALGVGIDYHLVDIVGATSSPNIRSDTRLYPFESMAVNRSAWPAVLGQLVGVYGLALQQGTGGVIEMVGIRAMTQTLDSGPVTSMIGINVSSPGNYGGSVIDNVYGVKVNDIAVGTNRYALHTGAGAVYFGGNVETAGTIKFGGRTLTGSGIYTLTDGYAIGRTSDDVFLYLSGGTDIGGAYILLYGKSHATLPGQMDITALGATRFTNTGSERMRVASSGNVGINDTDPAERLDVTGNINATGVYKVDDVQVLSNRVIDARCADVANSGDATTDGLIDALRDAMIAHGLVAAA